MKRFSGWAFLVLIVVTGLTAGSRVLGQHVTPAPTYLEARNCPAPCWLGVRPGVSTDEQFTAQLAHAPYSGHQWWQRDDQTLDMFEIAPSIDFQLSLADVMRVLGSPDRAACLRRHDPDVTSGFIYFNGGLIHVMAWHNYQDLRYTPDMQVTKIVYHSTLERGLIERTSPWRGFTNYHQCQ
jgi:hypothetical protein